MTELLSSPPSHSHTPKGTRGPGPPHGPLSHRQENPACPCPKRQSAIPAAARKQVHLPALLTRVGARTLEERPRHIHGSREDPRSWICVACEGPGDSEAPPRSPQASPSLWCPHPQPNRGFDQAEGPRSAVQGPGFRRGPSEAQGHWVHPVEPQATCGQPGWGHGQCFHWQADPKFIRSPLLVCQSTKDILFRKFKKKTEEPGQQLFPHPTEKPEVPTRLPEAQEEGQRQHG